MSNGVSMARSIMVEGKRLVGKGVGVRTDRRVSVYRPPDSDLSKRVLTHNIFLE
jgi:hypothetical protein